MRVWDAVGAENTKGEYSIISGRINDIAWDGDSQRVIAVGDGRERFGHAFTADSGNSVGEVTGHSKVVNAVSIRQQRPLRAATVSDDGTMCFLHGAPFKFADKAAEHKGFVTGSAFSPDGATLVTVGADRKIQLYDGKTGAPTKTIGDGVHTGGIYGISWASDSKRFVTSSADQTVRIWDAESGENTETWRFGPEGTVSIPDQQVGVVWPAGRTDGLIISLNLNGDLSYLVPGNPEPIRVVQGHNKNITALGASPDGKTLLTGSFEGRVLSWDLAKGTGTVVDGQSHSNQVTQFASSASGGTIYSVGWDDTLRSVDVSANTFTGEATRLSAQPKGVAATSDGKFVVVAAHTGIQVYQGSDFIFELPTSFTPTAIAASPSDASVIAFGGDGNTVRIHTLSDGSLSSQPVATLTTSSAQISTLSFSRDGKFLAAGNSTGKIVVYKTASWEVETDRWSAHTARVLSIAWNEAGTHAVSGGLDTNVCVWSLAKPGSRTSAPNAHKDGVNGVAWTEEGTVVSTGVDGAVKVWKVSGLP